LHSIFAARANREVERQRSRLMRDAVSTCSLPSATCG
jgi:hypothetical protein